MKPEGIQPTAETSLPLHQQEIVGIISGGIARELGHIPISEEAIVRMVEDIVEHLDEEHLLDHDSPQAPWMFNHESKRIY